MSKTKQTYKLGKIKQLIDLNRDVANFDLNFSAASNDGSEFYAVVVDQTTLDNEPNPEYKKVKGRISGNIVADKGVYQNYFLLLKADKPCDCDVTIEIKEIPKNPEWEKQLMNAEQMKRQEHNRMQHMANMANMSDSENQSCKMKNIAIVIGLVSLAGVLLYFYLRKKSNGGELEINVGAPSVQADTPKSDRSPSPDYPFFRRDTREPLFSKFR